MNIGLITCKKSADRCSGFGCFLANVEQRNHFEEYYPDDPAEIIAYFHCGGCENILEGENPMERQFGQLHRVNLKRVHLATCMKKCPNLDKIQAIVKSNGFECIVGTHQ